MLVLARKAGEHLIVGTDIVVTVLKVRGGRVRLGIRAPARVGLRRGERAGHPPPEPPGVTHQGGVAGGV
jgi:carbon storage regulator CsrA